jgi:hypothetical protein
MSRYFTGGRWTWKNHLNHERRTHGLDAPDKIKNTLFTLSSCSCIREIRASMLKTNQVSGKRSCFSCIHAIHGDKQENAPAFPAYTPSMAITTVFLISFE